MGYSYYTTYKRQPAAHRYKTYFVYCGYRVIRLIVDGRTLTEGSRPLGETAVPGPKAYVI